MYRRMQDILKFISVFLYFSVRLTPEGNISCFLFCKRSDKFLLLCHLDKLCIVSGAGKHIQNIFHGLLGFHAV